MKYPHLWRVLIECREDNRDFVKDESEWPSKVKLEVTGGFTKIEELEEQAKTVLEYCLLNPEYPNGETKMGFQEHIDSFLVLCAGDDPWPKVVASLGVRKLQRFIFEAFEGTLRKKFYAFKEW